MLMIVFSMGARPRAGFFLVTALNLACTRPRGRLLTGSNALLRAADRGSETGSSSKPRYSAVMKWAIMKVVTLRWESSTRGKRTALEALLEIGFLLTIVVSPLRRRSAAWDKIR
jgi:hypothetical protein